MKLYSHLCLPNKLLSTICILGIFISANAHSEVTARNKDHRGEHYVPRKCDLQQADGQVEGDHTAASQVLVREDYASFDPLPRFKPFRPGPIEHRAEMPPVHKAPLHGPNSRTTGPRSQQAPRYKEPAEEPITAAATPSVESGESPWLLTVRSQTAPPPRMAIHYIFIQSCSACILLLLLLL
eukprot:c15744_g1_i2 orf=495-1040(+)